MNYIPSAFVFFVAKAITGVWHQGQDGRHLIDSAMFQERGSDIIWIFSMGINPSPHALQLWTREEKKEFKH